MLLRDRFIWKAQTVIVLMAVELIVTGYAYRNRTDRHAERQDRLAKSFPAVSEATYRRVLDILFSNFGEEEEDVRTFMILTLRFAPSSHPESQIVIKTSRGDIQVLEYTSSSGNIYRRLNDALARGEREDPSELAKQFSIKKRTIDVSARQVRQWHGGFLDALSRTKGVLQKKANRFERTGEETLAVDGTFYDVLYKQGLNRIALRFYDYEIMKSTRNGEFEMVRWMNSLRLQVGKLGSR
jgi:hypothetical protein